MYIKNEYLDKYSFLNNPNCNPVSCFYNTHLLPVYHASLLFNAFGSGIENLHETFVKAILAACSYKATSISINSVGDKKYWADNSVVVNTANRILYKYRNMPALRLSKSLETFLIKNKINLMLHTIRCTSLKDIQEQETDEAVLIKDNSFIENEFDSNNMLSSYLQ